MARKIMTVDDSRSVRHAVCLTLKKENYDVVEAENGVDALDKLKQNPVDLFLVDVYMPKMDGISLIKEIRKLDQYRFTPILTLTTETQNQKKMDGKKAGATGWIVKPFKPDQLLNVIRKVMR